MAVYGIDFYGVGRFGIDPATVRPDFSVAPFTSTPLDYATLHLQWANPPSADCAYLRLVRNPRNLPMDEDDGVQVFDVAVWMDTVEDAPATTFGDPNDAIVTGATTHLTDPFLASGFHYYSMFGWSTSGGLWIRCTDLIALVPINWGYGARLYSLLPMAYRDADAVLVDPYNPWPVDGPNPPLQRYLQLIGFQFDFLRTELESLMSINDAYHCSGALLPVMAQQFGLVHEPEMGMQQERQLVANAVHLYKLKGTPQGTTEFVTTLTSYPNTQVVHHGYNELLTMDDGVMADGIGTWQAWPPAGTRFPAVPAGANVGLSIEYNPDMLDAGPTQVPGMTNPLETYPGGFPTLQPPYTNSGLAVSAAGTNRLTAQNSSFEDGTTTGTWTAGANTTVSNQAGGSVGGRSLGITSTRNNNPSSAVLASQTAAANTSYIFNADFQGTGVNRAVSISAQFYNGATPVGGLFTGQSVNEVTGAWTTAALTCTSPTGTVTAVTITLNIANTGNGELHLTDNIEFGAGGTDIYITTGPIPITDFMSQHYAAGTATFRVQVWSNTGPRQVELSLWGDNGSGTPIPIPVTPSSATPQFTETLNHWQQMTITGTINPYPNTTPGSPVPQGTASYYWIYPRIRILGVTTGTHYITLAGLWPCAPAKIGVDTLAYEYPRDVKILVQPTATNLLSNTLTSFSRYNPSPPPTSLLIGFDGLTTAADPTKPTANPTGNLVYRAYAIEDPPNLIPINGNASLGVDAGPGTTVWFGTIPVTGWSAPPQIPLGWFATTHQWFFGASQGPSPRSWFDPVYSWFSMNQTYFGVGSSFVNGIWFPPPAQPAMNGNLAPFQVQADQPFNFSVYAQWLQIQDPSNAVMVLGFRWYYPDGTYVEVASTPQQITDQYQRFSIAPSDGPFSQGEPPAEANTGLMPTTMFPFVRFPYAQAARFLLNSAMLSPATPGDTLPPQYMDATSQSQATGDFIADPVTNASYVYPRRTPRIARLTAELYRWLPMGATYTIHYASGAVTPPLDPTLW